MYKHFELYMHLLGIDDECYDDIDELIYDNYEIDLDNLDKLIAHLLPLVSVGNSIISNTTYKGFADTKNKLWLSKVIVDEDDNN